MARSKTRGGDNELFARIPENAMMSPALMTAPHAAFRVLAILLMGKAKERNGTMMCTDTYAEKFGITSRETVYRSLQTLEERGLIVRTRQGMRMRKIPTLWAVTWWPIHYQDGQPLTYPKEPTHAYLKWTSTPIVGVQSDGDSHKTKVKKKPSTKKVHTDSRGSVTPIVGVQHTPLHTDFAPESTSLHTDSREYSKSLAGGMPVVAATTTHPDPDPDSRLIPLPKSAGGRISKIDERIRKAKKHLVADPAADNTQLQRMYHLTDEQIQQVRSA